MLQGKQKEIHWILSLAENKIDQIHHSMDRSLFPTYVQTAVVVLQRSMYILTLASISSKKIVREK